MANLLARAGDDKCKTVILNALECMCQPQDATTQELECRLGTIGVDGHFVTGVNVSWFEAICSRLQKCNEWKSHKGWVESEDTFFTTNGQTARQSRLCDPSTCKVQLKTITKRKASSSCISLIPPENEPSVSMNANALKVAHASEADVPGPLQPIVQPLHVRIKQRLEFTMDSTALPGAQWRFDFTRTWSGENRESAETR